MAVNWSHDPYSRFADLDDEYDRAARQARKARNLEDRIIELEAQLKSVLHILEANGLSGDEERSN